MKPIRALRRFISNTDRLNDLTTITGQMQGALSDLRQLFGEKMDRLIQSIDNQSLLPKERLTDSRQADLLEATTVTADGATADNRVSAPGLRDSWLNDPSPQPPSPPRWSATLVPATNGNGVTISPPTNALVSYQPLLNALASWQGVVPKGYLVDCLGILTDAHFRAQFGLDPGKTGGEFTCTEIPKIHGENGNGELWFEYVDWFEAARRAREHFVMITLGALYGAQAVGAHRVLQIVNPLPSTLVAVEPVPENYLWMRKHFRDNGIDPDAHLLIGAAISDSNNPIFFPVGGAGFGANNCISTDSSNERRILVEQLIAEGKAASTLRNLMLSNTTGVIHNLVPGEHVTGKIDLVSAITLRDILPAFDVVDYLEADIQQSEQRVFPPFINLLKKKVKRIHIGTHGADTHQMLHDLFAKNGWEIVFSYQPNGRYDSELGNFELNDGVLTVRNPNL